MVEPHTLPGQPRGRALLSTILLVGGGVLHSFGGEAPEEAWGDIPLFLNRQAEATLAVAERALSEFPPQIPEPLERRMALLLLDGLLHEVEAPNRAPVQQFFHRSVERAVVEMEQGRVAEGATIWKLYDHAFVVRTPSVTVAFDLTRAHSAGVTDFALSDELITRVIRQCDALFVSHRHGDHADAFVARQFLDQEKPVVAPEDIWADSTIHGRIRHLVRDPSRTHLLPVGQQMHTLKVTLFPGHQGDNVLNNVTLLVTPEGLSFCHTGDQSNMDDFKWIDRVADRHTLDVLLPNCWTTDIIRMIRGLQPRLIITGHENELGHSIDHREPYWRTYQRLDGAPAPWVLMGWGESYRYHPGNRSSLR